MENTHNEIVHEFMDILHTEAERSVPSMLKAVVDAQASRNIRVLTRIQRLARWFEPGGP
jgi:hypothetical protein